MVSRKPQIRSRYFSGIKSASHTSFPPSENTYEAWANPDEASTISCVLPPPRSITLRTSRRAVGRQRYENSNQAEHQVGTEQRRQRYKFYWTDRGFLSHGKRMREKVPPPEHNVRKADVYVQIAS